MSAPRSTVRHRRAAEELLASLREIGPVDAVCAGFIAGVPVLWVYAPLGVEVASPEYLGYPVRKVRCSGLPAPVTPRAWNQEREILAF